MKTAETTRPVRAFMLAASLAVFLLSPTSADDVKSLVVQITPQQASTFASAFAALSQQAHVTIIAEDQPLFPRLADAARFSPSSALRAAASLDLTKTNEPFPALLGKVAAAYDYDALPSGKLYLLRKRYTDAEDLPSVTVRECGLALEEVNRFLDEFNPNFPDNDLRKSEVMRDLIYSLTPEQLQAMADQNQGLPVATLLPSQQLDVQQFVLHFYVQFPTTDLPMTLGFINRVSATDPQFSWQQNPYIHAPLFGYAAVTASGSSFFLSLSKPERVKARLSGGSRIVTVDVSTEDGMAVPPEPDTDPTNPKRPSAAPSALPSASVSLGDLVARLNARAAGSPKMAVESYLMPKRAAVFGEQFTAPPQTLRALADVYGLRVSAESKDHLLLTRFSAPVPLQVASLRDSIQQAVPDPLLRAYHMHGTSEPGPSPLFVSAVKRLRTAAEPKITAAKDKRVALSALSEGEQRAFAMTLMADAMQTLNHWLDADPPYGVTRFNDLRLAGGLYEEKGKKKFNLFLDLPNPDGSGLLSGVGVGDINYDPLTRSL